MIATITVWLLVSLPSAHHTPATTVATFATSQECLRVREVIKSNADPLQIARMMCIEAAIVKP